MYTVETRAIFLALLVLLTGCVKRNAAVTYRACFHGQYTNDIYCGMPTTKAKATREAKDNAAASWVEPNRYGDKYMVVVRQRRHDGSR